MNRMCHFIGSVFKSLANCYREAARQARESGENPRQIGFPEFRENEGGPPLFYTETCPEGTYMIGLITDEGMKDMGLKRSLRMIEEEIGTSITPQQDEASGPGMENSEHNS